MTEMMIRLRQAGLNELACQFAAFIVRIDDSDELVAVTAALLSEAVSHGHVCLDLAKLDEHHGLADYFPLTATEWQTRLKLSPVVGQADSCVPMILTDDGLLYLYKYWLAEQQVAKAILKRLCDLTITDPVDMQRYFQEWKTQEQGVAWQKIAVLMAMTRQFSVIAGGPGTGKTTIIIHLLTLLKRQQPLLKVALVAPTGKAATRLQQVVINSGSDLSVEVKTLHRLLGISHYDKMPRYNQHNKLLVDVLIVDEASMVDIDLMAKLVQALLGTARLVLLGDIQQLGSVEVGTVLSGLCTKPSQFSAQFCQTAAQLTDIALTPTGDDLLLADSVVYLQHNYRFGADSDIGQLAQAVKSADISLVYDLLANTSMWQQNTDAGSISMQLSQGYQSYFAAITDNADVRTCLQAFNTYRVLVALKQGRQSVSLVNDVVEHYLQQQGWQTGQRFYHGRPIMIVTNDYQQGLFNGDTGLIMRDEQCLRACFLVEDNIHWVDLAGLPHHETCFAMTIHKSQGSEFDHICILLPEEDSPLLTRQLLYTAITRAKKKVSLVATADILAKTVNTQHQRQSGLASIMTLVVNNT